MSASKTLWIDQLKVLTERRRTLLEKYEPLLTWAPWSRDAFEHQLTSISAKEVAILGMHDDLQVLVRNSVGAPKNCYHLADRPCGHAYGRGFRPVLEGQARANHLKRCMLCRWPADVDLRVGA